MNGARRKAANAHSNARFRREGRLYFLSVTARARGLADMSICARALAELNCSIGKPSLWQP